MPAIITSQVLKCVSKEDLMEPTKGFIRSSLAGFYTKKSIIPQEPVSLTPAEVVLKCCAQLLESARSLPLHKIRFWKTNTIKYKVCVDSETHLLLH